MFQLCTRWIISAVPFEHLKQTLPRAETTAHKAATDFQAWPLEVTPFQRRVSHISLSDSSVAFAMLAPRNRVSFHPTAGTVGGETLKYLTDDLGLPQIYPMGVVSCSHGPWFMFPMLSSSSGWGCADNAPFLSPTALVAHRFSCVAELSWSIMYRLVSSREMGQISSTSKGEISCRTASSFTSEAKTFSAKERIASSISARRRSRVQGHTGIWFPATLTDRCQL